MATENQMTEDQARDVLLSEVYHPVFFHKLAADYGISPTSQEEAEDLVAMAAKLRLAAQAEQRQKSAKASSYIKEANQALDQVLTQHYGATLQTTSDETIHQTTKVAMQSPVLKQAAQVFGAALAAGNK